MERGTHASTVTGQSGQARTVAGQPINVHKIRSTCWARDALAFRARGYHAARAAGISAALSLHPQPRPWSRAPFARKQIWRRRASRFSITKGSYVSTRDADAAVGSLCANHLNPLDSRQRSHDIPISERVGGRACLYNHARAVRWRDLPYLRQLVAQFDHMHAPSRSVVVMHAPHLGSVGRNGRSLG